MILRVFPSLYMGASKDTIRGSATGIRSKPIAQGDVTMIVAILIVSVHDDSQTVFGLLESGATGYVLEDEALETLAGAVPAGARGESWFSSYRGGAVRYAPGPGAGPISGR
jgi:DNA-binding NarL/FixJ family response regulator